MVDWLQRKFAEIRARLTGKLIQDELDTGPVISVDEMRKHLELLLEQEGIGNFENAYRLLDEGELSGTLLEVDLETLRFLEGESDSDAKAA